MHPTNCLNCGTILTADDNFCPTCGQKTNTHRLTISHFFHEFFHAFTHADKGFLGLAADLAVKPGLVAREYIGGKRKKYFNPFTFYLLCIGILLFSASFFKSFGEPVKVDPNIIAQIKTEAGRHSYITIINRTNTATLFIQKHLNVISMLFLPFFAFLCWIFFRRRGYNYSELMVAYMLFSSFSSLIFAVVLAPWMGKLVAREASTFFYYLGAALLVIQVLYIGIAQYRFLQFKNPLSVLVTLLPTLLGFVILFIIMVLGQFYYIFGSNWWLVAKETWKRLF